MSEAPHNSDDRSSAAFDRCDILALMSIAIVALAMTLPGICDGGLGWSDAPNHAMDGVAVLEFAKARPLDHARQWFEQFYLRHPSLGIIAYYPPGFATFEAGVFALLGVSITTARASVVVFVLGACYMMYFLGRRWHDRWTGLFAALLLVTCPHGFLWANDVMLEWPATFWILLAVYCYERDRETGRARWAFATGAAIIAAFLTKQTAGFILPVLIAHSLLGRANPRETPFRASATRIAGFFVTTVACAAYYIATRRFTPLPGKLLAISFDPIEVVRWLPEIVGWPLLPVAVIGVVTVLFRGLRGPAGLMTFWLTAWTGFCMVIAAKEPRYFFFALPPIMWAAVRFISPRSADGEPRSLAWSSDAPRIIFLAALVVTQAILARTKDTGRLPRFDAAVAELAARRDADLILIDSLREGQFVFDMIQNPATDHQLVPLRASKLLYARAAREKYDYRQFVQSPEEIVKLLDQYGIRYVLVDSGYPVTPYRDADPPPRKMLRELVARDSRFQLVKAWPLSCGDPIWNGLELRLYHYPGCPQRTSKTMTLPMPSTGRDVTFTLP